MKAAARKSRVIHIAVVLAVILAGCSNKNPAEDEGGKLAVGVVWPFSGALAAYGQHSQAGCLAAAHVISEAGGALGRDIECVEVDNKGNAAEAVPAVQRFLATTKNIVGVSGPETDTSIALAPLFNEAKVPWISYTGSSFFNNNTSSYFYRMALTDEIYGGVLAYAANLGGFKRAAVISGAHSGAQQAKPGLLAAIKKLGSPQVVLDLSVALDQPSYSSEVARVASAKPDVIIGEFNPPTTITFFSNLASGYKLVPFITNDSSITVESFKPLAKAIGTNNVVNNMRIATRQVTATGPPHQEYVDALHAIADKYPSALEYETDIAAEYNYTTAILFALAAESSKSTDPEKLNEHIIRVANPSSGATVVRTYAEGKAALADGKRIQYIPLLGPVEFDQYHTSTPPMEMLHYNAEGKLVTVPNVSLPSKEIQALVVG